ncbi:ATP-binding protein [Janthinobacterium sp.]|uniref:ATP-binding protein n=1 Tax=Janthinobacterium sp. TaxID=1871054 RepID=UPI00293D7B65|nr:ATP-binding protein [Janthinobacterium sp.]
MSGAGWSLRRRLLCIVLCVTMAFWLVSGLLIYLDAERESQALFDQSLAESAHLLLTLADHEVEERRAQAATTLSEHGSGAHQRYLLFQVWDRERHLLYKSAGAPDTALAAGGAEGYGWNTVNGQSWRTYAGWNGGRCLQVQLAEPASRRIAVRSRFAGKLLFFSLFVLPLLAASIWWCVNHIFRSLRRSADAVAERTPNDLRRVDLDGAPSELRSLLRAINALFERVGAALEREQRFTADAAHELRTPLAAIKTYQQVIRRARDDGERAEAVDGLGVSVERATRLVGQLMTLARLDPQQGAAAAQREIDLAALLATQTDELRRQAREQGLVFSASLAPARCVADPDSLLILLRNLGENALRYTAPPGRVELSCWSGPDGARLRVADSGAGIPPAMRERVFERFFRLPGQQGSGSGLGLSIVAGIAAGHAASVTLGEGLDGRGLAVEIGFAPAPATA